MTIACSIFRSTMNKLIKAIATENSMFNSNALIFEKALTKRKMQGRINNHKSFNPWRD